MILPSCHKASEAPYVKCKKISISCDRGYLLFIKPWYMLKGVGVRMMRYTYEMGTSGQLRRRKSAHVLANLIKSHKFLILPVIST